MLSVRIVSICLVLAALGVSVAWDGGYSADAQWTFAGLAAAAALAAIAFARARTARFLKKPAILVLLAIGWLSAVSVAWTIAGSDSAFRAGALAAGYGAIALATAVVARPSLRVALVIAVVAALTALLGMFSVALLSSDFADRLASAWRPEGPFGYAPALALVQVAALPVFLSGMARGRLAVAALSAACAALAAGPVVLAANRMTVALALLFVGLPVVAPVETAARSRVRAVAAAVLIGLVALGFHVAFGGRTPRAAAGELGRTALLLLIVGGAAPAWALFRTYLGERGSQARPLGRRYAVLAAGLVLVCVATAIAVSSAGSLGERTAPHGSFTHGRLALARISYHTFLDRPLQGYGAGSFLDATLQRQGYRKRLTRFAHNLPLELGVELGVVGLLLGVALYFAAGHALWNASGSPALWLLGPAVGGFLVANLVDWSWHLAGVGAIFALALGALLSPERVLE